LRATRPAAPFLELVHRLDRETSGCLIIAKRRSALRALHEQLREGRMRKGYLALVRGRWMDGNRRVREALIKNQLQGGERVVRVAAEGRAAETLFRPVTVYDPASLLDVELKTGRTHQIRVHATHIGHPLAGDSKYGDPEFNRVMRALGLRRLFLHAQLIEFTDPGNGESVTLSAPLGEDLRQVLDSLEGRSG
jgi:23S rRNA pseudouridine955/2504/2580 synthase